MEVETSPPIIAKKLWNIARIVFFMLRKGISKSKLMVDLNLMLKRGNKIANKAIGNLMFHHNHLSSSFSCRSDDSLSSFVSPREYEFSCSNSPAYHFYNVYKQRNHHHYQHGRHHHRHRRHQFDNNDMSTVQAVQKVLEMLNNHDKVEASPVMLPGFGRSPMVRQLRITDSPFPMKDADEDTTQVDKAAEEFIKKFYKELKQQKKKAIFESPYHDMWLG